MQQLLEDVLISQGCIGKDCKREKLYVSQTNQHTEWSNKYLFDYDNIDKTRLLQIIENNCK